jgi:hypothetical protein
MTALINKLAEVSFGLDSSSEPALLAIGVVLVARYFFRQPHDLEPTEEIRAEHFSAAFWWYLGANAFIGASLADFALIEFHLQKDSSSRKRFDPNFI